MHRKPYDGGMGTDIDEIKRTMRHEAIARRRTVDQDARETAGIRLAQRAADLLDDRATWQTTPNPAPESAANGSNAEAKQETAQPRANSLGGGALRIVSAWRGPALEPGDTVAAYVSMGGEAPTDVLLDMLVGRGLRVLVPRLGRGRDIGWGEYHGRAALRDMPRTQRGGLRPAEPEGATLTAEAIGAARVIFVPAFAIDVNGYRLGRGGGWYDRALTLRNRDAITIGICWDWELAVNDGTDPSDAAKSPSSHCDQRSEAKTGCFDERAAAGGNRPCRNRNSTQPTQSVAIPHQAHDVPVDVALTPTRTLLCR